MCPATRTAGVKVHHSRGFLACARRAHYERHVILGPCLLVASPAAGLRRGPRRSAPLPVAALLLALRGGVGRPPARARRPSCSAISSQHREPQPPPNFIIAHRPRGSLRHAVTAPLHAATAGRQKRRLPGNSSQVPDVRALPRICRCTPAARYPAAWRLCKHFTPVPCLHAVLSCGAGGPAQTALHCASGVRRQACGQRQGQQADRTCAPCTLASFHSKEWGSVMARGSPPTQASAAARPGRAGAVLVSRPAMPPFPRKRTAPCSPSCNASRQGRARCGLRLLHSCPTARASSAGTGERRARAPPPRTAAASASGSCREPGAQPEHAATPAARFCTVPHALPGTGTSTTFAPWT